MEVGLIKKIDIDDEMQQSYLDYAMSVIVSRALPDARDGLKPVHRRILYAMYTMGIRPDSEHKKSARIVGEVLGKFHPHGDMAVYDAMARMAQPFSMRYPLVDGQGNFGSMDGDPPAAMRYTEARMTTLAMHVMADIEKDTVEFVDNFDGTILEPGVLPAVFPNMLVNGATGIAVGMSTSIPPHNMDEVCSALIYMLDNWSKYEQISLEDLMKFIQGPDFPTGGIILRDRKGGEGLITAYATGRGKITLQARVHVEDMGRSRSRIIITELPYQTNKSNLIERIADLAREGDLEGVSDLRDESDRQGMRIVIELAKSIEPEKVIAKLYKRTPMRGTFSVIMLALVDNQPRLLGLKQSLKVFLDHRITIIRRRSKHDLEKAKERAHILEGLRICLKNLDEVIELIRESKDANQANQRLRKKYDLSDAQARAILDMPLRRLASLERKKIEQEYKETEKLISELEALLKSEIKIRNLIKKELEAINSEYGDRRRTQIVQPDKARKPEQVLTATDVATSKDTWVVLTKEGKLSRTPTARTPRLSGWKEPKLVIGANERDTLYLFDGQGTGAAVAVHFLPECDDPEQGSSIESATAFDGKVDLTTGIALPPEGSQASSQGFLIFGTRQGMVKKTELEALPGPSAKTFQAINVNPEDALGWAILSSGGDDLIVVSSAGYAIRFSEEEVRPMGLSAAGVMAMRLGEGDQVVGMGIVQSKADLLVMTSEGSAKRTALSKFPTQGRYGKGVLAWKSSEEVELIGAAVGPEDMRVMAVPRRGASRSIRFSEAKRRARASSGNQLFEMEEDNQVSEFKPIIPQPDFKRIPSADLEGGKPEKAEKDAKPKKGGQGKSKGGKGAGSRSSKGGGGKSTKGKSTKKGEGSKAKSSGKGGGSRGKSSKSGSGSRSKGKSSKKTSGKSPSKSSKGGKKSTGSKKSKKS